MSERLFSDGNDLQIGDKVRIVCKYSKTPHANGRSLWGQFREIIFINNDYLYLKNHTRFDGSYFRVTRMRAKVNSYIWEVQRRVVNYRIDQEPMDDEECI